MNLSRISMKNLADLLAASLKRLDDKKNITNGFGSTDNFCRLQIF